MADDDNKQDRSAPDNARGRRKGPGVLKVLQSVLAGAFGVQSGKRHQEDFSSHSPWPYIIAGIIFTVGFVVALALIVSWVLAGQ
ncbi:DUF2970 domain-containing protein [Marinobacter lacisalsi]|uniref:DUF2970 domain-containing protein n=1 Tax=Marinobacter lacisalsi TaxID=475979 RepID=A0ABV8QLC6_9GAMM